MSDEVNVNRILKKLKNIIKATTQEAEQQLSAIDGIETTFDNLYQKFHHIQAKIRFGYGNHVVKNVL